MTLRVGSHYLLLDSSRSALGGFHPLLEKCFLRIFSGCEIIQILRFSRVEDVLQCSDVMLFQLDDVGIVLYRTHFQRRVELRSYEEHLFMVLIWVIGQPPARGGTRGLGRENHLSYRDPGLCPSLRSGTDPPETGNDNATTPRFLCLWSR